MSATRYALRHFNGIRVPKRDDMKSVRGRVCKLFRTKDDVINYCAAHEIELGLRMEWDTSWQNYATNTWVAWGHDYVIVDLDEWCERELSEINGEGYDE
jgi:hypothetical protein